MVSSRRPNDRGVYCTTEVGAISTCVGNRWLPALRRLARKTSPSANRRPFSQIQTKRTAATAPAAASVHQSQSDSVVTVLMLSYFARQQGADLAVPLARFTRTFAREIIVGEADRQLPTEG